MMVLNGATHHGSVSLSRGTPVITWDDGEVWYRSDQTDLQCCRWWPGPKQLRKPPVEVLTPWRAAFHGSSAPKTWGQSEKACDIQS